MTSDDAAPAKAREALAERFSDLGWQMALEATPETAFLTQVRLKPAEPPERPQGTRSLLIRHFKVEKHPQTGQRRVVGYTPEPDTMRPVRDSEGPWTTLADPLRAAGPAEALAGPPPADDPEGWC